MLKQGEYLSHSISVEGMKQPESKVKAIFQAPAPTNLIQLCSFLGMVNHCGKFLRGLSSMLAPLYMFIIENANGNGIKIK